MQSYTRAVHTANVESRKKLILALLRTKKMEKVQRNLNFVRTLSVDDKFD